MQRKALVVDDSMLVRHSICRFLERRGFVAESAASGTEALARAADLELSIIITDLHLREMSGEELITQFKSSPATAAIPVVALARRGGADQADCSGRAEFLVYKDIDLGEQLDRALAALA